MILSRCGAAFSPIWCTTGPAFSPTWSSACWTGSGAAALACAAFSDATAFACAAFSDAAVFADQGDLSGAILHALDRRRELRGAGLVRASRFSWDEAARRTAEVYRSLM